MQHNKKCYLFLYFCWIGYSDTAYTVFDLKPHKWMKWNTYIKYHDLRIEMVSAEAAHALQTKENRSAWPAWVFLSRVRVKPEEPQKELDRRRPTRGEYPTSKSRIPKTSKFLSVQNATVSPYCFHPSFLKESNNFKFNHIKSMVLFSIKTWFMMEEVPGHITTLPSLNLCIWQKLLLHSNLLYSFNKRTNI